MKLSIVIPVFNEKGTLEELLRRIAAVPLPKEIVIVDDASTDGTRERIRALESEFRSRGIAAIPDAPPRTGSAGAGPGDGPAGVGSDTGAPGTAGAVAPRDAGPKAGRLAPLEMTFLYQPANRGKGASVRDGIARTTGDIVLVQDADLEYDPADYPALIAPITEGRADVVYGSRLKSGALRNGYFGNYLANRSLTFLSNLFTGLRLTDMESCYKVMRGDIARGLRLTAERFGFDPEITAKIARGGYRVTEVPISYSGRSYAEGKKIRWKDGFVVVRAILRYARRD